MIETIIISVFALTAMALPCHLLLKSWHTIDRLTDKVLAERSPAQFATYALNTPTKGEPAEAKSFPGPTHGNGNGKLHVGTHPDLNSYLKEHPELEEI